MKLPIVVLVGGLGKRLGNKVKKNPKPLIKINGKPFLELVLNNLINKGFKEIILCTGYLENKIIKFISKKKFEAKIIISKDGKKLLGTGGAVKKATKKIKKDFFLMYGDTFLPIDFKKVENTYFKQKRPALMTIYKNNNKYDKSNVFYNKKTLIYNKEIYDKKMNYIDYGLLIFNKKVLKNNKKSIFSLSSLLEKLSLKNLIIGHTVYKRFYEIGSMKGLKETKKYLKNYEL
tara:strand:+ start:297 stop:992 length:696 start_codon:yes stop_codon:yes gene_type:complete